MDKESAVRIEACIPQSWWEFSVENAMHCYNRTPVKHLNWHTPFEALTGEKPDISSMRVFGCGCKAPVGFDARRERSGCSKSSGEAVVECDDLVQVSIFQDRGSGIEMRG